SRDIWPGLSGNYLFTRESWLKAGRYYEPSLENQTLDSWTFGIRQLGTGAKMVTLPGSAYFHRYGHASHYVREHMKGNRSIAALIGVAPFLDRLEEKDVDYILSRKGRYVWYENLKNKPIRVKDETLGHDGSIVDGTLHIVQTKTRLKAISFSVLVIKFRSRIGKIFRKLQTEAGKWRT
ncbi:MAG: hypothetical protein IMZ53_09150, partial [Thermoplasmata archaeon]|nr:hypothetical protein [Thermoplasmata archaeon]